MLTCSHLVKQYASVRAVDDVSLEVAPGEMFGLLGPNGAGKTTTIRMIMNILRPDGGEVRFDGAISGEHSRNLIGYVPEERGLYRKNKLMNMLVYFGALRGLNPAEAERRAKTWLARFNLGEFSGRKVEELSKGNQQKIQFIVAVLHDPPYLVLDEPFSGLDPVNQILLKDILLELKRSGKAIIFSTHMMDQAEKLCERIALIHKGKVVLEGSLRSLKQRSGKNSFRIEYEGDGSFLSAMPLVKHALTYENYAEVELYPGASANEVLSKILGAVTVRKFEFQEPSLHSIFLSAVGEGSNGGGGAS